VANNKREVPVRAVPATRAAAHRSGGAAACAMPSPRFHRLLFCR